MAVNRAVSSHLYQVGLPGSAFRARQSMDEVPATTAESDALSKELRRRGSKFVGSTICYALMQATGLVNDHTTNCFRYDQVG